MKRLANIIYSWINSELSSSGQLRTRLKTRGASHITSGKSGRVKSPDERRQPGHPTVQSRLLLPRLLFQSVETARHLGPWSKNSWHGKQGAAGQGKMPAEVCLQPQLSWGIRSSSSWLPVSLWVSQLHGWINASRQMPQPNRCPHLHIHWATLLEDSPVRHETSVSPLGKESLQHLMLTVCWILDDSPCLHVGRAVQSCWRSFSGSTHNKFSTTEFDDYRSLGNTLSL